MFDFHNHKGQKCVYGPTFCQEGYCSECDLCLSPSLEKSFNKYEDKRHLVIKEMKRELVHAGN